MSADNAIVYFTCMLLFHYRNSRFGSASDAFQRPSRLFTTRRAVSRVAAIIDRIFTFSSSHLFFGSSFRDGHLLLPFFLLSPCGYTHVIQWLLVDRPAAFCLLDAGGYVPRIDITMKLGRAKVWHANHRHPNASNCSFGFRFMVSVLLAFRHFLRCDISSRMTVSSGFSLHYLHCSHIQGTRTSRCPSVFWQV